MDLDFIQGQEYKVIKIVYYTEGNNIFSRALKEPEIYVLTLGDSEWRHKVKRRSGFVVWHPTHW